MIIESIPMNDNSILELRITLGWHKLCIEGDKIGLFDICNISKCLNKQGTLTAGYTVDGLLLEIHHDCVAEIEMLVKEFNWQNSTGIRSIEVEHTGSMDKEEYYVYEAYRNFHYCRVNSNGDLRIILGKPNEWPMVNHFEVTPNYLFDDSMAPDDYSHHRYAKVPELQAKNYKSVVYKRMRKTASIIAAMQLYCDPHTTDEVKVANTRFVYLLSVLDKYIQFQYGKHIGIDQYTYYDEDEGQWRNIRVDNLLRWYPHAEPSTEYEQEIQFITEWLRDKDTKELGGILFRVSMCNNEFVDAISNRNEN